MAGKRKGAHVEVKRPGQASSSRRWAAAAGQREQEVGNKSHEETAFCIPLTYVQNRN